MRVQIGAKRLGVALGAGGLRGAIHIGVLRSLERHGIAVQALSGSSAGAIVAAFSAVGYSSAEMESLVLSLDAKQLYDPNLSWRSLLGLTANALLSFLRIPERYRLPFPTGLLQGTLWLDWLYRQLGVTTVAEAQLPLAILAADIDSGEAVVFSQLAELAEVVMPDQPLALAVRASSAIPGVFSPAYVSGRTLVDGGVKASVPAELVRGLGADTVLAVDLGAVERDDLADNIYEIISQSLDIMGEELTTYQLQGTADLVIRPVVQNVSLTDFDRIPELIRLGEQTMDQAIPALRRLLAR